MKKRSTADEKATVPNVGLFFVVDGKPFVDGLTWTENQSIAGFRTYGVGHPEYWQQLQGLGVVPEDMPYEECPRGRVNYEDASGRFTLFADRCIVKNKKLISKIMSQLCLPRGTRVLVDDHYRCPRCLQKRPTRRQDELGWDF